MEIHGPKLKLRTNLRNTLNAAFPSTAHTPKRFVTARGINYTHCSFDTGRASNF